MASFPERALWDVALTAVGDMFADVGEGFFGEFGAGFAEGDCLQKATVCGEASKSDGREACQALTRRTISRQEVFGEST
jgi:hypothetical protein